MSSVPYRTYNQYLRERFGERVHKITIDAGFTCPHRNPDGSGGCTFCNNAAFNPNQSKNLAGSVLEGNIPGLDISGQISSGKRLLGKRFGVKKFIAYFQAHTNTLGPVDVLAEKYELALTDPSVVGIAIGTRPDCLPEDVLDLLHEISSRIYLSLEIGLQSANDSTLTRINRGHDFAAFEDAVSRCKRRDLDTSTHVILGLPGETRAEMIRTAVEISRLGVHGVKIHPLHVCKGTRLENEFIEGRAKVPEQNEYVDLACDFLEYLDPEMYIHRLTGEADRRILIAPEWINNKQGVVEDIHKELKRRGTKQGARAKSP